MKILKKFFKNDQKLNVSEIAIKKENDKYETLDKFLENLIETGHNENFYYEKYSNGYMKMYHKLKANIEIKGTYGNFYYGETTNYNFPIEFNEIYCVQTNVSYNGRIILSQIRNISNTQYGIYLVSGYGQNYTDYDIYTEIIGSWK